MKPVLLIFFISLFFSQEEKINKVKTVIVGKNVMLFHSMEDEDIWTVQTINRNFNVFKLSIDKGPNSAETIDGVNILHYESDSASVVTFYKFSSNQHKETISLNDIHNYGINRNFGVKEKVSMIAYLNRKKLDFVEKFFEKTFTVGDNQISTTLKRPVDVIKYVDGKELIYQDDFYIHGVYPSTKFSILKTNYQWFYKNGSVSIVPTEEYLKNKPISAIKTGRDWYNKKWIALLKKGKLEGIFTQNGINWYRKDFNENEKSLIAWWKKS